MAQGGDPPGRRDRAGPLGQGPRRPSTRPTATSITSSPPTPSTATSPNIPEVRRHLKALDAEAPRRPRTDWIAARIAASPTTKPRLDEILNPGPLPHPGGRRRPDRPDGPAPAPGPRRGETRASTSDALAGRVEAVSKREALAASSEPEIPSTRIARISLLIEEVQRSLIARAGEQPAAQTGSRPTPRRSTRSPSDLPEVAGRQRRGRTERLPRVCRPPPLSRPSGPLPGGRPSRALKSPAAAKQAGHRVGPGPARPGHRGLSWPTSRTRADTRPPRRTSRPSSTCKVERFQALGHLFQGAIDLEKAGMVADAQAPEVPRAEQAKLRASALGHLRIAATQLPRPRRGPGPLRRGPDPQPGAGDGPAVPPARPAAGQPRAAVPDLGRLVGRPGRLPGGRRADRGPDAPGGRGRGRLPQGPSKGPCTCSAARSTRPGGRPPT